MFCLASAIDGFGSGFDMSSTYKEFDTLARVAERLFEARASMCRLAPYVLMTDPQRVPDITQAAQNLPKHSALIYRHFGASDREFMAHKLRQICFDRGIQFLVGADEELARGCGADGVHLPERDLDSARVLHIRYPDWILTGAIHSELALAKAAKLRLDACLVSPVFASDSRSAGQALGVERLEDMVRATQVPVIALGGINGSNVQQLVGSGVAGIAGISGFTHV
jgi:thiamine-phosphate pyrophosphorylase